MALDFKPTEDITEKEDVDKFLKILEENEKHPGKETLEPPQLDHLFKD